MIGALLMVYAIYYCKKHGEDKEKIAAEIDQLHAKGFIGVFKESFFAILSPVIILDVFTQELHLQQKQRLFPYFIL